jgi:hypothetical protein
MFVSNETIIFHMSDHLQRNQNHLQIHWLLREFEYTDNGNTAICKFTDYHLSTLLETQPYWISKILLKVLQIEPNLILNDKSAPHLAKRQSMLSPSTAWGKSTTASLAKLAHMKSRLGTSFVSAGPSLRRMGRGARSGIGQRSRPALQQARPWPHA